MNRHRQKQNWWAIPKIQIEWKTVLGLSKQRMPIEHTNSETLKSAYIQLSWMKWMKLFVVYPVFYFQSNEICGVVFIDGCYNEFLCMPINFSICVLWGMQWSSIYSLPKSVHNQNDSETIELIDHRSDYISNELNNLITHVKKYRVQKIREKCEEAK